MTDLSKILTIVAGVSSVIGLLSVGLTLYFWFAQKQRHEKFKRSVREIVEGDRFFNAEQVIAVLERLGDDAARLKALRALTAQEAKRASELLTRIKKNVDLKEFDEAQRKSELKIWIIISVVFVLIALLAVAAKFQFNGNDDQVRLCREIDDRLNLLQQVEDNASLHNKCSTEPVTNRAISYQELWMRANTCDSGCLVPTLQRAKLSILSHKPDITLTYLYASAGIGKSTVFRETWSRTEPDDCDRTCTYKIDNGVELRLESLKLWFNGAPVQPDLTLIPSGRAINSLPGDENSALRIIKTILRSYGEVKEKTILVLDDLDELHPSAAKSILKEIDQFLSLQSETEIAHILVAGRAEGFIGYERKQTSERIHFQAIRFRPPVFLSTEDIKSRYDNYVTFRKERRGSTSVSFEVLLQTLANRAFLCESYSIQMLSGPIINNAASWGVNLNEGEIKDELLNEMFTRNQKSHGRPPAGDPDYRNSMVMAVFKQLSPRPHDGDFFAPFDAQVPYGGQNVNVINLLDRSGFVQRDPIDIHRYKFVPNWVPSHLLRMYAREKGCSKKA